jgi:hypothetical protein
MKRFEYIIDRIFKSGIITTSIGVGIIITSIIGWIVYDIPASEVAIVAGIGTGLLFLKDKHIGIK